MERCEVYLMSLSISFGKEDKDKEKMLRKDTTGGAQFLEKGTAATHG